MKKVKNPRPGGRGFDLPPEGAGGVCHFRVSLLTLTTPKGRGFLNPIQKYPACEQIQGKSPGPDLRSKGRVTYSIIRLFWTAVILDIRCFFK